jgi:hypothetical protein
VQDKANNPLIASVLQVLQQQQGPLGIHQLLQELKKRIVIPLIDNDEQLALFKLNWLMMNALYQLQMSLFEDGLYLTISTLHIQLQSCLATNDSKSLSQQNKLRDYYLDWTNFTETTQQDVEALLRDALLRFNSHEQSTWAYQQLGIQQGASANEVRLAYRRLANLHHPDKGGSTEMFMQIRQAYEVLRWC